MRIEIAPRDGRGGTEFLPEPSRLHLGGQQAEGVDKLEFSVPAEWDGKDVSLYIEHADGIQQTPVQLDEENAGGCQLIRAAQYAGILPGGEEEHSEPMLDDEGWEEYIAKQEEEREEKKKKKKKKGYGDWDSDDDGRSKMNGNGNENEEDQSEEDDELPEEYVELMKKEKRRKQKQKERKERLKRTRHSHMSYSVCEIKIGRTGRSSDLQIKVFDSVRIEFFIISLCSHEFRDRSIQNRLESIFIECRSFPQGLSVEWREMLL